MTRVPAAADISRFPDDVEVGVMSHNGRNTLGRLLECLERSGAPCDRIFIYDIASTDDTKSWLASAWPGVTVRTLTTNAGPNPGRNWALRAATQPYVLLMDADAYVRPAAPALLRAAMDPGRQVGLVTPVVVDALAPTRLQYAGVGLHYLCEAVRPLQEETLDERGLAVRDIGTAAAVTLLINAAAAHAVGLFEERYFLGKEDGEFCYRLRLSGYRLVEEPRAIVDHLLKPRSTWMFVWQIRNRWHFMLKNYETRTLVVLAPVLLIHEVLQLAVLITHGHLRSWWQAVTELRPWLPSLPTERREVHRRRRVHDRDLLDAAPLVVRSDLVGGGAGRIAKRAYDVWLRAYWRLARPLLP